MNAYAARLFELIQGECLNRTILAGQESPDRSITEYVAHYHEERRHQGPEKELVSGRNPRSDGSAECEEGLGGLLSSYFRTAV